MRIGIVIGRIGGIDGVALETEKWIEVLRRAGHEVFLLSGAYERDVLPPHRQATLVELSFFSSECQSEQDDAFFFPVDDPGPLLERIDRTAEHIRGAILDWVRARRLDVLISENASALPCHLSMGVGIQRAVEDSGILTLCHDHDYAWERGNRYVSPHEEVNRLVRDTFPLRAPTARHLVINSAAVETLRTNHGREALLVPNVMDFDEPFGVVTEKNTTFPRDVGIAPDDVVLLQPTRIVRRKGIDVALRLVHALDDPRVKLMCYGTAIDDDKLLYARELVELVRELKLEKRVLLVARWLANAHLVDLDAVEDDVIRSAKWIRESAPRPSHVAHHYTLSDVYAYSRACTYFSTYEGFGNAFLETVVARKPIFVNNYEPIYWPDIGSKGFRTVQLEKNELTDEAVAEIRRILHDPELAREIAEHNFEIGREHFSYQVLARLLDEALSESGAPSGGGS